MVKQSLVGSCLVGALALTGSPAVAAVGSDNGGCGRSDRACAAGLSAPDQIPDPATGLVLSTVGHASGATTFRAVGRGFEAEKTLAPDGAFSLELRCATDHVRLSGTAGRLTVVRQGRAVEVRPGGPEEDALQRAAMLVAGSPAIRMFRAALGRMAAASLESEPGLALQFGDALLRVIQDDAAGAVALVRRQAGRGMSIPAAGAQVVRLGGGGMAGAAGETCFSAWKAQVLEAWNEYEACYHDFSWWSGGREVCAFLYIIEVESAWFKMLSCSSIKIT